MSSYRILLASIFEVVGAGVERFYCLMTNTVFLKDTVFSLIWSIWHLWKWWRRLFLLMINYLYFWVSFVIKIVYLKECLRRNQQLFYWVFITIFILLFTIIFVFLPISKSWKVYVQGYFVDCMPVIDYLHDLLYAWSIRWIRGKQISN
jgi:hypothetical protein